MDVYLKYPISVESAVLPVFFEFQGAFAGSLGSKNMRRRPSQDLLDHLSNGLGGFWVRLVEIKAVFQPLCIVCLGDAL